MQGSAHVVSGGQDANILLLIFVLALVGFGTCQNVWFFTVERIEACLKMVIEMIAMYTSLEISLSEVVLAGFVCQPDTS